MVDAEILPEGENMVSLLTTLLLPQIIVFQVTLMKIQSLSIDNPILTIGDGLIRGKRCSTVEEHKTYYSFRGIPFAKPPLGSLRFKPPIKNSKWFGILDATKDKNKCVQGIDPVVGTEDCLYINVYTPSLTKKNMAVVFWIYGGAFIIGDSTYANYGPDKFMDEDVVVIDFNYRMGAFGFLSTNDLICPGNNGLRDQLLALKWVQTNIEVFGGDPTKVTIYGQSAGAASAAYLIQSESGKGLFSGAILSSGTSLCGWALNRNAKEIAYAIGNILNVNTTNSETLLDGLRKINYVKLQQIESSISTEIMLVDPLIGVQFGPVIEPCHKDAVVTQKSIDVMSFGKFNRVPILMGVTSNEASAPGRIPGLFVEFAMQNNVSISDYSPTGLSDNETVQYQAGKKVKFHYFGDKPPSEQPGQSVEFISDSQWDYPVRMAVIKQSKFVPVYFYGFWYEGELGGITKRMFPGVGHSEDLGYIFRAKLKSNITHDYVVSDRMIKLITNFAKYRNPTPKREKLLQNTIWPVSSALHDKNIVMLKIGYNLEVTLNPFYENMNFYDELFDEYGTPPSSNFTCI